MVLLDIPNVPKGTVFAEQVTYYEINDFSSRIIALQHETIYIDILSCVYKIQCIKYKIFELGARLVS